MNARSGFGISSDSEKKVPYLSSAVEGCRLAERVPSCATCRTEYPAGTEVCPRDGSSLTANEALIGSAPTLPEGPIAAAAAGAATAAQAKPEERFDSLLGVVLAGRYEVLRRIGEGGMGAVYEARHTLIGKRVAVKVLLEKFHAQSDLVARLLQEARLASSIGHENIVDVTDFGTTDDGRSFVVMEFLDGESLAGLAMREAPLPIERSLRIARQVASALGAAHAKGIFHRDVKPENIYLIQRGDVDFVKVVDFGISKAVKPGGDDGPEAYRLTHTGLLLGTPLYMSPEQARGSEDLDHRVDIWALGVLLYECLTGEVPFHANNYLQIISQVLTHQPMPPSQLRPELGIPDAVEAVVMRAMEKDRTLRYQTMAELERDLERLLAGDQNVGSLPVAEGTPAAVVRPALRRWPLALAATAALIGGVALAVSRPGSSGDDRIAHVRPASAPRPSSAARSESHAAVPPTAPAPTPVPHKAHPRPERRVAKLPEPAAGGNLETSESVKRGVLPAGSREAYPQK
jgi:eukaryotic-like serine/threonine-protein kinase